MAIVWAGAETQLRPMLSFGRQGQGSKPHDQRCAGGKGHPGASPGAPSFAPCWAPGLPPWRLLCLPIVLALLVWLTAQHRATGTC